jgi:hypothetical protein
MMNDFRIVKNSNRKVSRKVPLYKLNPNFTEDGQNGGKYLTDEKGYHIQDGFKHIEEPSSFCPEDAVEEHKKTLGYIKSVIEGHNDQSLSLLVITHQAVCQHTLVTNTIR